MQFDNDCFHQEMNMIQDCIKRMASNSFMLKGWYVSLVVVAASILGGKSVNVAYPLVLLLTITCVCWGLDGFFLKMETLYRWKYEWVIEERLKQNDDFLYDLNPYNSEMWKEPVEKAKKLCLMSYILSKTLTPLYGLGIMVPVLYFIYRLITCVF